MGFASSFISFYFFYWGFIKFTDCCGCSGGGHYFSQFSKIMVSCYHNNYFDRVFRFKSFFLFSSFMVRGFINNIFLILFLVFMVIEARLGMRLVGILSRLSSNQSIKV